MKKFILITFALIFLLFGFSIFQYFKFNDGKLHIVFCNVGQGDGIFIRSPKGLDILVDSGPDDSILDCLSNHMPFWDRTIELSFLTHPHEDHMRGFISVFKRYEIQNFATEKLSNDTVLYREVIKESQKAKGKNQNLLAGDRFRLSDGLSIQVVGPSKDFLERTSPSSKIGQSKEFASLELLVSFGSFNALLTGDSQIEELNEALQQVQGKQTIDVFQIPHHGSKYGTDNDLVQRLNPKLTIISVGKNKYGHPAPSVLKILSDLKINYLRTDSHGDIEIVVDKTGSFKVY